MKKRSRRLMIRITSLIFSVVVLMSCLVSPVSATSDDDTFMNVLDFSTVNDSGSQVVSGSFPIRATYRTSAEPFRYVDMVISSDIADMTVTYAGYQLNTVLISNAYGYTYRVYGDLVGDPNGYLDFYISGSSGSTAIFEQLRVTSLDYSQSVIQSTGKLFCNHPEYGTYTEEMSTPQADVRITFDIYQYFDTTTFLSQVTPLEWEKFDYVDLFITVSCSSIDSITAKLDYSSVPYTITYLDSEYFADIPSDGETDLKTSEYRMCIRLDVRGLDRTSVADPYVEITGTYAPGVLDDQYIMLTGVTGIVCADVPSELGTFWQRLQGFLVALFGAGDPEAGEAAATQEQVDYEMNLYVVDAVNDWDGNVEYVESGFTSGLALVSPALAWIGSLASRIFINMGGFSAMYLVIGFMSVIMLLLSKSGIASKISNSVRSSSGGGKKGA